MSNKHISRSRQTKPGHSAEAEPSPQSRGSKFTRLFIKQLAAAIIFIICVFCFSNSGIPFLCRCTESLGRAVRYETDFDNVKYQITDIFFSILKPLRNSDTPKPEVLP